jgi:hypothetical protein
MLSADVVPFCLLDACFGRAAATPPPPGMLDSIGTLAIQQLTRSLDEESDSLALYQFDLRIKSSRQML